MSKFVEIVSALETCTIETLESSLTGLHSFIVRGSDGLTIVTESVYAFATAREAYLAAFDAMELQRIPARAA